MNKKLYKLMNWPEIEAVVYGEEKDPFKVLGPHICGTSCLFQTFVPKAKEINLIINGKTPDKVKMELVDEDGFFAQTVTGKIPSDYLYEIVFEDRTIQIKDAYSFKGFEMKEAVLSKIRAGIKYDIYKELGAHPFSINGFEGYKFAVWAPNAVSVFVVGDFNNYNEFVHPMKLNGDSGIYELFIPDVKPGDKYKFFIKAKGGDSIFKADPYSSFIDKETGCSVIFDSDYKFNDSDYYTKRKKDEKNNIPLAIYEVMLSSFARDTEKDCCLNYREIAPKLVKYVKEMGYTHVQLMPVTEHTNDASWGYQTCDFYALTDRYGTPGDFKYFVDVLHQNDIGVILDWVPNQFSNDDFGLIQFDGTCLYEHLDPKKGIHPFYGTRLFNYGRPEVSNYLISNALYFVEEYHVDGLCMDSVASMLYLNYGRNDGEWIANIYGGNENLEAIEFIKHLNSIMNKLHPDVLMLAKEDSGFPKTTMDVNEGGLGFDYKYNNGMINDYFDYISYDPYFRAHHHSELTLSMIYQYSEHYINALSHENFVYGKNTAVNRMPGEKKDRFANLRTSLAYMYTHPGAKLIFEGQDFGIEKEFDEHIQDDWNLLRKADNKGIRNLVKDLNKIYKKYPALFKLDSSSDGFEWINSIDSEKCILSFLRKTAKEEDTLLVICNFAGVEYSLRVGTPIAGKYKEILNTDAKEYGGKNKLNLKNRFSSEIEADGKEFSVEVKAPALSVCIFQYIPFTEAEKKSIEKKKEAQFAKTKAAEYHENAIIAQKEIEELTSLLEETKLKIKDAKKREEEALKNENIEILKAKKALEEALNE